MSVYYSIDKIAECLTSLTYVEMMEIATDFSRWTEFDEEGEDCKVLISPELMASLLDDWARQRKEEADERNST